MRRSSEAGKPGGGSGSLSALSKLPVAKTPGRQDGRGAGAFHTIGIARLLNPPSVHWPSRSEKPGDHRARFHSN